MFLSPVNAEIKMFLLKKKKALSSAYRMLGTVIDTRSPKWRRKTSKPKKTISINSIAITEDALKKQK